MKLDAGDHVQLRDGTAYYGTITNSEFHVQVAGTVLSIRKTALVWIIFRNQYGYRDDQVQLKDATELHGTVQNEQVTLRSDSLGDVRIEIDQILAMQFLGGLGD